MTGFVVQSHKWNAKDSPSVSHVKICPSPDMTRWISKCSARRSHCIASSLRLAVSTVSSTRGAEAKRCFLNTQKCSPARVCQWSNPRFVTFTSGRTILCLRKHRLRWQNEAMGRTDRSPCPTRPLRCTAWLYCSATHRWSRHCWGSPGSLWTARCWSRWRSAPVPCGPPRGWIWTCRSRLRPAAGKEPAGVHLRPAMHDAVPLRESLRCAREPEAAGCALARGRPWVTFPARVQGGCEGAKTWRVGSGGWCMSMAAGRSSSAPLSCWSGWFWWWSLSSPCAPSDCGTAAPGPAP